MGAHGIERVGICGSGIMGGGLAEVVAAGGFDVVVRSRTVASARAMVDSLVRSLERRVASGRITSDHRDALVGRIEVTDDLAELSTCDLVIESVLEDLDVKRAMFAELGDLLHETALLATNTSTLPVVELAIASGRPDRVCGIHFFNPAPVMPLVEIARPLTASDDTIARAHAFARACGKESIDVADRAGFVVNALLFPYLNRAVRLLEEGVATMEAIDTAMRGGCNFPMGPFAVLDLVGLDTSVAILDALYDERREADLAPAATLRRLVTAGRLGRKAGQGFYEYR